MVRRPKLTDEERIALEDDAIQKLRRETSSRRRRTPPRNPTTIVASEEENESDPEITGEVIP